MALCLGLGFLPPAEARRKLSFKRIKKELNRTKENVQESWNKAKNFVEKNTESYRSWDDYRRAFAGGFWLFLAEASSIIGGCRSTHYHGLDLLCFTQGTEGKVIEALDFLAKDPNRYPGIGSPLNFVKNGITAVAWAHASAIKAVNPNAGNRHEYIASHQGGKLSLVLLSRSFMEGSVAERAAVLLHEAAHATMGKHTCGDDRDMDAGKVYGLEIKYLAEVASRGEHPLLQHCADRQQAYNSAVSMDQYRFCSANHVFVERILPRPCVRKK